jgi:putative two-component system response regulator
VESKSIAAEPGASRKVRELLARASAIRDTHPEEARDTALQARIVARAEGDRAGEAASLYRLASLSQIAGDPEDAFGLAVEAQDVAAECGAEQVTAWVLHLIGVINYQAANYTQALEHCLEALDIYESPTVDHDGVDIAHVLNTIALVYTYERALAVAEPYGLWSVRAIVTGNIARIRASRSEYLSAVSLGRSALDMARAHCPSIVTQLFADLGEAYMGLADPDQAMACFAAAHRDLVEKEDEGQPVSKVAQLGLMLAEGRVALRRGALDEAIAVLGEAGEIARETEARESELEIYDLLATAYKRHGYFEQALDHREQHDELHRRLFSNTADLRLRTLQVAFENSTARAEAEILRLRSGGRVDELDGPQPHSSTGDTTGAAHLEAFEQLAILTEFRDADTGAHTDRVGDLAAEIGHALGQAPEWCEMLRLAARLHDIGKVVVPDSVLFKTGPLTVEEYEMMKAHTSMGHRILAGNSAPLFQMAAELAQSHHEWWDGSGYPLSLTGSSIALTGRIVAVADVYDALCSKRPYKRAWPKDEAARFVISGRNGQFDPDVIDAFVSVLTARDPELSAYLR